MKIAAFVFLSACLVGVARAHPILSLLETPNIECKDKTTCANTYTCCLDTKGTYGCCPMAKAVCCSDHVHCCPAGYKCDVSAKSCVKSELEVSSFVKIESKELSSPNFVKCPDQQTTCPDGNTCCPQPNGKLGCCPLAGAVCCSDGLHCCPSGTKCDNGRCLNLNLPVPVVEETAPFELCPDQSSSCPSGNTCCKLQSGNYGCCPMLKATCCSDGVHCCPEGYTCDVADGTCMKQDDVLPLSKKTPALKVPSSQAGSVTCADETTCPVANTCCLLGDGKTYGCCPQVNAVCCSDHVHCCPEGYTCDVANSKCKKQSSVSFLTKLTNQRLSRTSYLTLSSALQTPKNVICPGQQTQCPDGNTCCAMANGGYGCCPQVSAVCCSDHVHCCPCGYTCDLTANSCIKGDSVVSLLKKAPALKAPKTVDCPDGGSCKDGQTCCKVSDEKYGCCPVANAVCCDDMKHCCPSGYTCTNGQCEKETGETPFLTSLPATVRQTSPEVVVCKDGKTECPNQNTCCKLEDLNAFGCCPLPLAACCKDGIHCCPNGYTCEAGAKCSKGDNSLIFLNQVLVDKPVEKLPALKSPTTVTCDDGQSECEDNQTCCKLASGTYGCCPSPNAVCCDDGVHCCPEGTTCNVGAGTCTKQGLTVPFLEKLPALKSPKTVDCPDGGSCKDGQTCCKVSADRYGCCPVADAVCCDDMKHCCPSGYTCTNGECEKEVTFANLKEASSKLTLPNDVLCPNYNYCLDGQTCCQKSSGGYGCCPYPSAVCCAYDEGCCPITDYCCTSSGKPACCRYVDNGYLPFLVTPRERKPAVKHSNDVPCPNGDSCLNTQTCCELADGDFGCCPSANAVCCDDHRHCCPSGETCDKGAGTCSKGGSRMALMQMAFKPIRKLFDGDFL